MSKGKRSILLARDVICKAGRIPIQADRVERWVRSARAGKIKVNKVTFTQRARY